MAAEGFSHITAASSPPADQYSGAAQTYEQGNVGWNNEPSVGGPLGWVCIEGGTQGITNPAQFATFGTVGSPSKAYGENKVLDRSNRYITVTQTGATMTLPANSIDGQTQRNTVSKPRSFGPSHRVEQGHGGYWVPLIRDRLNAYNWAFGRLLLALTQIR